MPKSKAPYAPEFRAEAIRLARTALFAYIETFYNRRRHSALGYVALEDCERRYAQQVVA